jgi:hypothetical protein
MKKKFVLSVCAALLALCAGFTAAGCSEAGPARSSATAISRGHGGTITEVSIVIDGYGGVVHAAFDEIFNVTYGSQMTKAVYDGTTVADDLKLTVGTAYHYKYLSIADKVFEARVDGTKIYYDEISDSSAKITDVNAYMNSTQEAVQWYYDAYKAGKLQKLTVQDDTAGTVTVAGVKYKTAPMNTIYGSMRKSQSTYWSNASASGIAQASGLGWKGNMEALAQFLYAHGFTGMEYLADFDSTDPEKVEAVKAKLKLENGYVNIENNGISVTSGATLSGDTYLYLGTAYKAFVAARGY